MAGENSLPTQYYHDDQQVVTEVIVACPAGGVPILYADRNLIVDSVVVGVLTASSGGATATIQKSTSTTMASPATILAGSVGTFSIASSNTFFNLTTESGVGTLGASTKLDNTKNTLDAGSWLMFVPASAATASLITVQVRFRSRPK